jgi:hypothetical protein
VLFDPTHQLLAGYDISIDIEHLHSSGNAADAAANGLVNTNLRV